MLHHLLILAAVHFILQIMFFLKYLNFWKTINLGQIALDLHLFKNFSAARREDYKGVSSITKITSHFVLKHCQTRWLSLDCVLVRIIEQIDNIKEYFLVKLPVLPGFKGKNGIRESKRYQRIKNALTNPATKVYMSFFSMWLKILKNLWCRSKEHNPKYTFSVTNAQEWLQILLCVSLTSQRFTIPKVLY